MPKHRVPLLMLVLTSGVLAQERPSSPTGDYLGQEPPGSKAERFAPGLLSTPDPEGCATFSHDGRFLVFRRHFGEETEILIFERRRERWAGPRTAPFFLRPYRFGDFTFAPSAVKLYFTSNRPLADGGEEPRDANIWVVEHANGMWRQPVPVDGAINSPLHDSYPSVSKDGTIFFFRRFGSGEGGSDIMTSQLGEGGYSEAKRLGKAINTEWEEWDPAISPDGQTLVFCSKKPGGLGVDDLYVSFRNAEGGWSEATNLGSAVNSAGSENRPFVTADGRYLFFTSDVSGNRDVYWISMDFVTGLRDATGH